MPDAGMTAAERRALAHALETTRAVRHWRRLRAVWLYEVEQTSIEVISTSLGVGHSTVYKWVARYRATRTPAQLADRPRAGRPPCLTAAMRTTLAAVVETDPQTAGYHTKGWTAALLAAHLSQLYQVPVHEAVVRHALHALTYRWKRPRYVLARRDPERAKKKGGPGGDHHRPA